MGNQHLHPVIQQILDSVTEPRHVRCLEVENKIDALRPDFSEAEEIIDAVVNALVARYDHALLDDIRHYATYLGKALERAEVEYTSGDLDRE